MTLVPRGATAAGRWSHAGSLVRADLLGVARGLREAWALGGLRRVPLSLVCTALVLVFSLVQHTAVGEDVVEAVGVVHASLPLSLELLRTPLSLFVPALDLPAWGAMVQVLVVFGLAELTLGRGRTAVVALAATLAGTMYARLGVWLGPDVLGGLPATDAFERDTGPSAAVVALAVYLAWYWRSRLLVCLVGGAMLAELAADPNLAGREHLAAILAGVALAVADRAMGRRALARVGRAARRSAAPRVRALP